MSDWEDAPSVNGGWEDAPSEQSSPQEKVKPSKFAKGAKAAEEHLQTKIKDYRVNPQDALFDTLSLDLPFGIMEQIPAAFQAAITTGAKAAGGIVGAFSDDSTAGQTGEHYANTVGGLAPVQGMTPTSKSGVGIAGGIGALIEEWKDRMPEVADSLVGAVPFVGKEWEKAPGMEPIRAGIAGVGSALPELGMVKAVPGMVESVNIPKAYRGMKDAKGRAAAKQTVDEMKATQAAAEAKGNVENVDVNLPEQHDTALLYRLKRLDDALNSGRIKPQDRESVMAEREALRQKMAAVGDRDLIDRLTQIDKDVTNADVERLADRFGKQAEAQEAIFNRQREMEQQVARQQSLDFNAAERARQEAAPVPGLEELKARQAQEQRAAQEQAQRLQEARQRDEITAQEFQKQLTDLSRKVEQLRAQHQIELRQKQMEMDVARQRSLDFNAAERGRQDRAPIPGMEEVNTLAQDAANRDPRVVQAEGQLPAVEERAVDSGAYGDLHSKFMEESLRVSEQRVENLKNDIADSVRKNPIGLPTGGGSARTTIRPRVKGLGQRGAIGDLRPNRKAEGLLGKLVERYRKEHPDVSNFIPNDPDPKKTIKEAQGQKDADIWNLTETGSTMAAAKTGNAMIRDGGRILQNANKRSDLNIKNNVLPVESALRKLDRDEILLFAEMLKEERLSGTEFSPETLSTRLNGKQLAAYSHFRTMMRDTFRIQNEMRKLDGLEPMDGLEAYVSHRWDGDLRRPIYEAVLDKDGNPKVNEKGEIERKLVYYLADWSKKGLEKQWAALQKERPDLLHDPAMDHRVRQFRSATDLQSSYSTILDLIGRDDPAAEILRKAVEEQKVNEAYKFLSQDKHFKAQTGVRGFVGDRPGKAGTVDEALAMLHQQIQYAKNAYRWAEFQQAAQGLKVLFSDPDLVKNQPNAVKYLKELYKNYLGLNEAKAIAQATDSLRDLGVPTHLVTKALGNSKTFFLLQKLALNAGYTIAGVLQSANTLPFLAYLNANGFKGNPLTAAGIGVAGGVALAMGHYADFLSDRNLSGGVNTNSAFWKKAFKYAEDNGVTARSLMDESPIESKFSATGMAANFLSKTMVAPEVIGRSIAFMTFVEFLRSSGEFKGRDIELFQKAEEAVNMSMVDYRAAERPMIFSKLGALGNFANTLQTYPMNWYNQWNLFGREAMKGNMAPVLTAFATQYAMAGVMGIPGFSDIDKLYQLMKDHVVSNKMYVAMRENEFWNDPKVWMMKHFGHAQMFNWLADRFGIDAHLNPVPGEGVFGPLSARNPLGINITSRVAAPGAGEMIQAPFGPAVDIIGQGANIVSAALDPKNVDKRAQAAMSSALTGLQGLVEQAPFMEGKTFENRGNERVYGRPGAVAKHEGIVTRDSHEETLRNFGLRSQREAVEREMGYRGKHDADVAATRAPKIIDEIYSAAKRGDKEEVKDLYSAYVKLTGNEISQEAWNSKVEKNFTTSLERMGKNANKLSIVDLKAYSRIHALMDEVRGEYQRRRAE